MQKHIAITFAEKHFSGYLSIICIEKKIRNQLRNDQKISVDMLTANASEKSTGSNSSLNLSAGRKFI